MSEAEGGADLAAQRESLATLYQIADDVYRALDRETVARRGSEAIRSYTGFDIVSLLGLALDGDELELLALSGTSAHVPGGWLRPRSGHPLVRLVEESRGRVLVDDVAADPRIHPDTRAGIVALGMGALQVVPMVHAGELVGVVGLLSREPRRLDPLRDTTLEAAVGTLAAAFANARRVELLRRAAFERRRAEDALRESEERHRALAEHSRDVIAEVDPSGRVLWVSPSVAQLGYRPEEFAGNNLIALLHPEDQPRAGRVLAERMSEGGGDVVQARIRDARGDWRWYEASGQTYDLAGGERRAVVVARSIEESRRAEGELRAKTESLEALNEIADTLFRSLDLGTLGRRVVEAVVAYTEIPAVSLWSLDAERRELHLVSLVGDVGGRFAHAVPVRSADEGLAATALRERRLVAVADVESDRRMHPEMRRALLEGGARSAIVIPLLYQGEAVGILGLASDRGEALDTAALETLDALGKTIASALVNARHVARIEREIAERQQAEAALRESEERFRQLAENTEGVFFLVDIVEDRMLYVSPSCERLIGVPAADLYEDHWRFLDAVHPEDRARIEATYGPHVQPQAEREYRVVLPGGEVRWITDRAQPIEDEAGNVVRIAGYAQDVTARKELEQQLRQSQKMEAIGSLAGGIAHDFNNILTAIHGYGEILLAGGDDAELRRESSSEILRAAERATSLTRQLLTFSRRQVPRPQVVSLDAVVSELQGMLGRLIGEDVALRVETASGGAAVEIDRGQLEQVIVNLALNARDAMPGGGELEIHTEELRIPGEGLLGPGRFLRLLVRDTGTGMDESTQERIFEPFFTTKPPGKGTGLGLSTAYGIVHEAGGRIRVQSAPFRGTTFEIDLPAAEPEEAAREATPAARPAERTPGSETLLLVEDEDSVRALERKVLEREGYRVLEARDGVEALQLAATHADEIDMVVTDLVMPRLGGLELSRRLARLGLDVPVLVTSGYAEEVVPMDEPRIGFLDKPFTPAALCQRVRELLEGRP